MVLLYNARYPRSQGGACAWMSLSPRYPSKIPRPDFRSPLSESQNDCRSGNRHMRLGIFLFLQWKTAGGFGSAGVRSQQRHFLSTLLLPARTPGVKSAYMRRGINGAHRLVGQPHPFNAFVGVYGGYGGEGGIRTLEAPCGHLYDFQSYSLGLSDTSPQGGAVTRIHESAMRSFVYHGRRRNVSPPSQSRLDFSACFPDDSRYVRKEVILI